MQKYKRKFLKSQYKTQIERKYVSSNMNFDVLNKHSKEKGWDETEIFHF